MLATKTLLPAVDACSKSLPHSNEAARAAQSTGELMQHHFGIGSAWLTVTFNDDNCLVMQVLSDCRIDNDKAPKDLTADEISDRNEKRSELRLKFPGFAAILFKMLLAIVVEEVIGWDMRTNRSTGKVGFFSVCEALSIAFEEQGQKSIHGHITLHIRGVHTIQEQICFGKKIASKVLTKYHDHFVTTYLFNNNNNLNVLRKSFEHECRVTDKYTRKLPTDVENEELRMLCHKLGYVHCGGRFAYCSHCNKNGLTKIWLTSMLDIC